MRLRVNLSKVKPEASKCLIDMKTSIPFTTVGFFMLSPCKGVPDTLLCCLTAVETPAGGSPS